MEYCKWNAVKKYCKVLKETFVWSIYSGIPLQIVLKAIYIRTKLNSYPKASINHVSTPIWSANFLLVTPHNRLPCLSWVHSSQHNGNYLKRSLHFICSLHFLNWKPPSSAAPTFEGVVTNLVKLLSSATKAHSFSNWSP